MERKAAKAVLLYQRYWNPKDRREKPDIPKWNFK